MSEKLSSQKQTQTLRFEPTDELQALVRIIVTRSIPDKIPAHKPKKFLRTIRTRIVHEIRTEINSKNFRRALLNKDL